MISTGASRSIHRRLALNTLFTTAFSLLFASGVFVLYDFATLRAAMLHDVETVARVVGPQSAIAMGFMDHQAATETLGALEATDAVSAAVLYDEEGLPFARHLAAEIRQESFRPPPLRPRGHLFRDGSLEVFHPVVLDGERVGTLYIRRQTGELRERAQAYAALLLVVLLAVAGLATLTSRRLRRTVSQPLEELLAATEAIAAGDLRVRVPRAGDDEIGRLATTFNDMTDRLRELLSQVRGSIENVSSVTGALQESSGSLNLAGERQEAAIAEAAASVDHVASSIVSVKQDAEQLAETARETSTSVCEMDSSIGEVSHHMRELGTAIETGAHETAEMEGNIERVVGDAEALELATRDSGARLADLHASVGQVARNAEESHRLSEDSTTEADVGMTSVRNTMSAMAEISKSFRSLETAVGRLSDRSQAIGEILEVIGGITAQTNLLALNAAIIAARAGEHGRAFSVVAGEVRNLADGTARATQQISELILGVQEETRTAVEAVAEGAGRVDAGVRLSREAGRVLDAIIEKASRSTERVSEIVTATARQALDLEQVDEAYRQVSARAQSILESTRSQHRATTEIARQVEHVRALGVEVGHSISSQRNESLRITAAVERVAEMSGRIAEATQSEAQSSETIREALRVFTDVTAETSKRVEALDSMVGDLSSQSSQLEEEMRRFGGSASELPGSEPLASESPGSQRAGS